MTGMCPSFAPSPIVAVNLLGQDRLTSLGSRFRDGGGELDWLTMFTVVLVLGIAIGIVWRVARYLSLKDSGEFHSQRSLFGELCRADRLGWRDRRLLVLVARQQGVTVPARMFVEPERFEPGRLEGLAESQRRRAAELSETLFRSESHRPA